MMKNLKKAELVVIALTLLCLSFTAGFFIGRGTGKHVVTLDTQLAYSAAPAAASPSASPAASNTAKPGGGLNAAVSNPTVSNSAVSNTVVTSKLNINSASLAELEALPGIGKVLGQNIIDYREKIGGFKTVEEIRDVDGIGDKKFAAIKDLITAGQE